MLRMFVFGIFALATFTQLKAQKTDTLFLRDETVLIGEIKQMTFNVLQVKTHGMSTVNVKWQHVEGIISPNKVFILDIKSGFRKQDIIYGSIDTAGRPGYLKISTINGEEIFHRTEITSITQVKKKFWSKFSGNIGIGANYQKSSNIFQFTVDGGLTYQSKKFLSQMNVSAIRTNQQDTITTSKADVTVNSFWYLNGSLFVVNYLGFNRNTQLGIDQRYYLGAGAATVLLTTNNMRMLASVGAIRTFEFITDGSEKSNYEGTIQHDFRVFKNYYPEIALTSLFKYYPSFTVKGRHRIEYEFEARFEVVNDLYVAATFYYNYDSKPSEQGALTDDFGFNLKVSYKFGL